MRVLRNINICPKVGENDTLVNETIESKDCNLSDREELAFRQFYEQDIAKMNEFMRKGNNHPDKENAMNAIVIRRR